MKILDLEQWTNSGLLIQRSHITSPSHSKIFLCIFTNHKDWGKYWFDIKKPVLRHKYELQLWSVKNILGITNRNYTSRELFDNLKLIKVFINSSVNYNNASQWLRTSDWWQLQQLYLPSIFPWQSTVCILWPEHKVLPS